MTAEGKKKVNRNVLKKAVIKTLPVMVGYLVLGLGFGIIAEKMAMVSCGYLP